MNAAIEPDEKKPGTRKKRVHLRPRLIAAANMLRGFDTVADIGCDHGRLSVALLQSFDVKRAIAVDISAPSLEKAAWLAGRTELSARINLRLGDGLAPLEEHEADAIALCGMGGMLMAEILSAAPVPLMGAKKVVLQPMRGVSAIRAYLYAQGYRVEEDCVVEDAGRLYQVFSATIGKEDPPPAYWPNGCMRVGFKAADDPLFLRLVQSKRRQYEARLLEANGTRGEDILNEKAAQMRQIEEAIQCGWKYS